MYRAYSPHERILERVLNRAMDLIADVLDRRLVPHNQRFREIGFDSFPVTMYEHGIRCMIRAQEKSLPFGIDTDQSKHVPASLNYILDTQIQFAAHNACVRFPSELVQEVQTHAVNLVIDIETFDVFSMVFHNDVNKIIHRRYPPSVSTKWPLLVGCERVGSHAYRSHPELILRSSTFCSRAVYCISSSH